MERTYTSEEVEAIVCLATRLQNEHQGKATLEEIEKAAAEFGVEPKFVHLAAAQLSQAPPPLAKPASLHSQQMVHALIALQVLSIVPFVTMVMRVTPEFGAVPIFINLALTAAVGFMLPVRRPGLLVAIPFLATTAITIFLLFATRAQFWPSDWMADSAIITLFQVVTGLVGYGVARLVEHLKGTTNRSAALGR